MNARVPPGWSAKMRSAGHGAALLLATCCASAVFADTKAGVDAWEAGRYNEAIAEWRTAAAAGDADAAFNLGQAYKVGRGVPQNLDLALQWYSTAMKAGHVRASDYYGLLLYQLGRHNEAIPYITKSAERGEPRAQYVLGAELFNGTFLQKDWVRAYAMMTRASAQGLEPANRVLAEMDQHIPLVQRQQGIALSNQLEQKEASERLVQMASWDLRPIDKAGTSTASATTIASARPAVPASTGTVETVALPRSNVNSAVAAKPVSTPPATASVAGAPTPVKKNISSSVPVSQKPAAISTPAPKPTAEPKSAPAAAASPKTPAPVAKTVRADGLPTGYIPSVGPTTIGKKAAIGAASPVTVNDKPAVSGNWRVQMGAYSAMDSAQRVWKIYQKKVASLASYQPYLVKADGLVKLQYGGFVSRAAAVKSCAAIEAAGGACFAVKKK